MHTPLQTGFVTRVGPKSSFSSSSLYVHEYVPLFSRVSPSVYLLVYLLFFPTSVFALVYSQQLFETLICASILRGELSWYSFVYHHHCTSLSVWRAETIKTDSEAGCLCLYPVCYPAITEEGSLKQHLADTGGLIATHFSRLLCGPP